MWAFFILIIHIDLYNIFLNNNTCNSIVRNKYDKNKYGVLLHWNLNLNNKY